MGRSAVSVTLLITLLATSSLAQRVMYEFDGTYAASGSGDLNADGYADVVIVRSPGTDIPAVYVFSGREGAVLRTLHGSGKDDMLGYPFISSTGDANGDGLPDLALASSHGVVVVSGEHSAAAWANYGSGWPGSGGVTPGLIAVAPPVLCSSIDLASTTLAATSKNSRCCWSA